MDEKKIKFDNQVSKDHFRRLPDELLLSIFSKMPDLKTLCHCSMVSKRFDLIISEIRAISMKYPFNGICTLESENTGRHVAVENLPKLELPTFMEKFPSLESIYCEYTCPKNVDISSPLKWKANYSNDNAMIESLFAMSPVSVHKKSEFVRDQEPSMENYPYLTRSQMLYCLLLSLDCYTESLSLIQRLKNRHATLKCVTVADSGKLGKLVIRDENLINIKSCIVEGELSTFKYAWVPELHLPLSGFVMIGVLLLIIKGPKKSNLMDNNLDGEDDNDIMAWDFDEEEKVFGEAIKEVLKHRHEIYNVELPSDG